VTTFKIDQKLLNDCHVVADSATSHLLLSKNALFPWFILVPKTTEKEFYRLDEDAQIQLLKQIKSVSFFIDQTFEIDKMNIATIGNVVSQLHIHIVGRQQSDACWPSVVWGFDQRQAYKASELSNIISALNTSLKCDFEIVSEIV